MLSLLKHFNYIPPKLENWSKGVFQIRENAPGYFYLYVNGEQWMAYDTRSHFEAYELFSHYILAKGNVTVTGMGFGVRENWILTKPEVTKLTIIEKNKEVIDYHKENESAFLKDPRVEVICMDASEYKGSCDVLLLDHYEGDNYDFILADVKKVHDNVDCKSMWFWPFELIIMHSRRWHTFNDEPYSLITKYEAYLLLKKNWKLDKLQKFEPEDIDLYCMMSGSKMFSRSEHMLEALFADRDVHHEIYRRI